MTTLLDVYRFFLGGMPTESDSELQGRLSVDVLRYKTWGNSGDTIFHDHPEAFSAHEQGDVKAFASALGVPWPVPERVTMKSLVAELESFVAKLKAFSGV